MLKPFYERKNLKEVSEQTNLVCTQESKYSLDESINVNLNFVQKRSASKVLRCFDNVFSSVPGKMYSMSYEIKLNSDVNPIASLLYKIPFHLKTKVKEELEK